MLITINEKRMSQSKRSSVSFPIIRKTHYKHIYNKVSAKVMCLSFSYIYYKICAFTVTNNRYNKMITTLICIAMLPFLLKCF